MNNKSIIVGIIILAIVSGGIVYSINKNKNGNNLSPAQPVGTNDISRKADNIPGPITRKENTTVIINLEARQVVAELAPGTTYEYWTYNSTVPGPFIRVKEGDTVEVRLAHVHADNGSHASQDFPHSFSIDNFPVAVAEADTGHDNSTNEMPMNTGDGHAVSAEEAAHMAEGQGEHSIDLHSVMGPGGGAMFSKTKPDETTVFQFKARRAGLFIYHCASPHIPTHIANGMYGMILVEPAGGLSKVDREFYIMQGELYTAGHVGQKGHQEFSKEKLLAEQPEYVIFNGRQGALTGTHALKARTGEKIRLFVGVCTFLPSNFHVIGGILDALYPEGDLVSPPHRNVQTTLIPAGGAAMAELTLNVPGKYLLVDHSLARAIDRGAVGEIVVEGKDKPDIYRALP